MMLGKRRVRHFGCVAFTAAAIFFTAAAVGQVAVL